MFQSNKTNTTKHNTTQHNTTQHNTKKNNKHYDLCVLRQPQSVRAVFQIGPEWDRALQQFLQFVRAHSPLPGEEREWLGDRWTERVVEEKEPASVKPKSAPARRAQKKRRA